MSVVLAAHFERLIATNKLVPGSRLPSEREMAETFDVSRSTLREAMHELEGKRLIERRPGRGTTTCSRCKAPLRTFAVLPPKMPPLPTPQSYGRSSSRPSPHWPPAGRRPRTSCSSVTCWTGRARTCCRPSRCDWTSSFTRCFARAAQNPLLESLQARSSEWTNDVRQYSHATRVSRRISTRGHHRIYDAVRDHDPVAAQEAMMLHLEEVRELIAKATKKRGE